MNVDDLMNRNELGWSSWRIIEKKKTISTKHSTSNYEQKRRGYFTTKSASEREAGVE